MSGSREELCQRLKAARLWLEKAERSFDAKTPLRGELNLMLAQAEMQKLREERRGVTVAPVYRRGGLALIVAVAMVAALGGVWQTAEPLPQETQVRVHRAAAAAATVTTPTPTVPVAETYTAVVVTTATAPSPAPAPVTLSNAELNAVVNDAARVLRRSE